MGARVLLSCLSLLLSGFFNSISAQNTTDPNVIITDHNGNTSPITINCDYSFNENHRISLKAQYPEIKNPTSYSVSSIPFSPVGNFSEGDEISIDSDDKWSSVQQLPFDFCFYGNTFSSIIVGDNGVISFNTEYAETECPYTIAGSIPDPNLIHNAIFGAYHDMTNDSDVFGCISDCGKISLYTTGTAPFRKAVINYYKMNHFGCEFVKSTLQIVLYETTNIIEVYIKDKPYTCSIGNEKRTLVGISNQDGSMGISPEGRNTGIWETYDEAWRFTPEGRIPPSTIKWFDANHNILPSTEVNPNTSTFYSVEISYASCTPVTLTNKFQIIYSPDYPTAKDIIENRCFEGDTPNEIIDFEELIPLAIGNQKGVTTSLHATLQDANSGENPITGLDSYLMTSTSKSFYLRVMKDGDCYTTALLTINLKRNPVLTEIDPIIICSESDKPELIYLHNYDGQINGYESWMILEYFDSYENAINGLNPINTLSLSNTMTVYVKVSNPELNKCFSIIPLTLALQKIITTKPQTVILCDDDIDGREVYDLTLYEKTINSHDELSFSYYTSKNDALHEVNSILNPDSYSVTNGTVIYVKISSPGFCSSINSISISFKKSLINNVSGFFCDDNTDKMNVNLLDYYHTMTDGADIVLDGIYLTWQGAQGKDSSQLVPDLENFTVIYPSSTVYVRFFDNVAQCNFIREINITIIRKIEKIPSHEICDLNNDGEENLKLSTLNPIIMAGYPPSSVTYYATLDDYNNETNPITEIVVKGKNMVYVKLEIYNSCSFFYKVELNLISFGLSKTENISICDSENDGNQNYNLNQLISIFHLEGYTSIKFYKTENDAFKEINAITNITSHTINSINNMVYVRANYKENCPTIIPVKFILLESVKVPNLTTIEACDKENDKSVIVDLTSAIVESGVDTSKILVEFYVTLDGAESQSKNEQINNYTSFTIYNTSTVFVRFTNISTNCYIIKPLTVKLNPLPVIIKTKLEVCDFNNDGKEDIILSQLNSQLVNNTYSFAFTYFLNEIDAVNNENAITKYSLTQSSELYVKISSGVNCYIIQKISFTFLIPPTVYNQNIEICDNNADDKEIVNLTLYESLLTGNNENTYSYKYFTTFENAYNNTAAIGNSKDYTIQKFPTTIFVRISDSSKCISIAELTFNAANKILAENKSIHICDEDSNMQEYINITQYISEILISKEQNLIISYYATETGANTKNNQDLIKNPDNYSATLAQAYVWIRFDNPITGCYTIRYLEINLEPLPKLINGKYLVCDTNLDDVFSMDLDELRYVVILNPEGYTFTYYHTIEEANNGKNKIDNPHHYIVNNFTENIVVKATNQYGCSSIRTVTLYTQEKIPVNSESIEIENCDDNFDGITSFDLTSKASSISKDPKATFSYYSTLVNAQNQSNPITTPYNYKNIKPHNDKVYVRISSPDYCPSLSCINLSVLPVPVSPLEQELKICPNGTLDLVANTEKSGDYYEWSTGEKGFDKHTITINKTGIYTVTITGSNGCQYTYTTNVTEYSKITITDLAESNDYITVIAEGPSPLEYSLDNINWQKDNTFYNLEPGIYTFYVRSLANGCISPEKKGIIFKINNVITPNGDNLNDVWKLCGLENFDSKPSHIKIFDRYGKEVFSQSSNTCFTWNGYFLGNPLPTTSYWYIIEIIDGRKFTGWITLRNHNGNVY